MNPKNWLHNLLFATSLLALAGCQTNEEVSADGPGELVQHAAVSDCGGFDVEAPSGERDPGYCDAEVLEWEYDATAQTLMLIDRRVSLNCCGDRNIAAEVVDGELVITEIDAPEIDAPEGGEPRCRCMCAYDFSIILEGVDEGVVTLSLFRHVTDSDVGPELIWAGDLDLSSGVGVIELDASPVSQDSSGICGE